MNPGKLRHKAYLQRDAGSADTQSGAITESWTNMRGQFVGVTYAVGGEEQQSEQVTPVSKATVLCRHSNDITTDKRWLIPRCAGTVSAIAGAGTTSITISDADILPNARHSVLRIGDEFVIATAGWGTTSLTVTRGAFGSSASAHASGTACARYGVFEILDVIVEDNIERMMSCQCKEIYP